MVCKSIRLVSGPLLSTGGYRCSFFMSSNWALALKVLPSIHVAAQHHVVGVHLLGDAIDGRPRRQHGQRDARVVESVTAIVTADDIEPWRSHALRENFWEGFADPLQTRRTRLILKRHNHKGLGAVSRLRGRRPAKQAQRRQEQKKPEAKSETRKLQSNSIIAAGEFRGGVKGSPWRRFYGVRPSLTNAGLPMWLAPKE